MLKNTPAAGNASLDEIVAKFMTDHPSDRVCGISLPVRCATTVWRRPTCRGMWTEALASQLVVGTVYLIR